MILTGIIISLVFIVIIIIASRFEKSTKREVVGFIGVLGTFVSLFGFGMFGTMSSETYIVKELIPIEISKSESTVFVELSNRETLEYTSKIDYFSIDSTTVFYEIYYYNYFGVKLHTETITKDTIYKSVKLNIRLYD